MSACWVVRDWDGSLKKVADLYDPSSGRGIVTWTTEPALLTFTGRNFSEAKYPSGRKIQFTDRIPFLCKIRIIAKDKTDAPGMST